MRGSAGLAAGLALLAGAARAQEGPIEAPCLAVHPQPADYVAAFEAEGWTFHQDETARGEALRALGLSYLLATQLPARPATAAELDALMAAGADPRQARRFAGALVFSRGDAAAALDFDAMGNGMVVSCWITAPDLPQLDGVEMSQGGSGTGPRAVESARLDVPVPEGATGANVNVARLASDVEPSRPVPGAETIVVSFGRIEPRRVVPHVHGPLRAFGAGEMVEALTPPEDAP